MDIGVLKLNPLRPHRYQDWVAETSRLCGFAVCIHTIIDVSTLTAIKPQQLREKSQSLEEHLTRMISPN